MVHLVTIFGATFLPELGDETSFKVWATQAVHDGIHQAYRSREFGYYWLPFYMYVSKGVGLLYTYSGLATHFGRHSHMLTVVLKLTMTMFHLGAVVLVYVITNRIQTSSRVALRSALLFGVAPGTVLATAAFGYQDAFHTLIVVSALWLALTDRVVLATGLTVMAALTKPQAASVAKRGVQDCG